ncbi:MFS transporter [Streptomyces sp. NPDC005953]|uniref:MFS transporter n=1 Tax=Streptomyces sp. NPDC005953 TaxID=3156719 RepID=UPI0033DADC1C
MLTQLVADDSVTRALSVETTLTQITWASAPPLVVVLALRVHAGAPLVLGAILAATAAILLLRLPETEKPELAERPTAPITRTLLAGWPIYLTSAASMAMLATAELVLPALLEAQRIAVGWSGPLLAGFALASAVGALCYGSRTWPGSLRAQSLVFLVLTAACLVLVTVLPGPVGIAFGLLLAGVFQSGVMVSRNLASANASPHTRTPPRTPSCTRLGAWATVSRRPCPPSPSNREAPPPRSSAVSLSPSSSPPSAPWPKVDSQPTRATQSVVSSASDAVPATARRAASLSAAGGDSSSKVSRSSPANSASQAAASFSCSAPDCFPTASRSSGLKAARNLATESWGIEFSFGHMGTASPGARASMTEACHSTADAAPRSPRMGTPGRLESG